MGHNSIVVTLELPPETPESRVHGTGTAVIGSNVPLPAKTLAPRSRSEALSRDMLYTERQAQEQVAITEGGPRVANKRARLRISPEVCRARRRCKLAVAARDPAAV